MVLTVEKETALPEGVRFLEGEINHLPAKIEIALPERKPRVKVSPPDINDPSFLQKAEAYEKDAVGDLELGNYKKYLSVSEARNIIRTLLKLCLNNETAKEATYPIHEELINIVDHTDDPFVTVEINDNADHVTVVVESRGDKENISYGDPDPNALRGRGHLIMAGMSEKEAVGNKIILTFKKTVAETNSPVG